MTMKRPDIDAIRERLATATELYYQEPMDALAAANPVLEDDVPELLGYIYELEAKLAPPDFWDATRKLAAMSKAIPPEIRAMSGVPKATKPAPYRYAYRPVCKCGELMDDHSLLDNHSPVEMKPPEGS